MALRRTVVQGIQDNSDYKKQHEFFVVSPTIGFVEKPKSAEERSKQWLSMCQATNLELQDHFLTGNGSAVLIFKNGLQLSDNGHRVSFSAIGDKEAVDMHSAMTVIRCSANHLCRRGWDLGVDFSTVRYGSAGMVNEFEKSYRDARRILNAERIAQLRNCRPKTA